MAAALFGGDRDAYILPLRLDDTKLRGLRATIGYLDLRNVGVKTSEGYSSRSWVHGLTPARNIARSPAKHVLDLVGSSSALLMTSRSAGGNIGSWHRIGQLARSPPRSASAL